MDQRGRPTRLINGNILTLHGDELERFFIFAYKSNATNRTLVAFAIPLLFMVDWLRDLVSTPESAQEMLLTRGCIVMGMLLCAVVGSTRRAGHWREWAGFVWTCLIASGLAITSLYHPAQVSLIHVVTILLCMILTPHGLRPVLALAVPLALLVPMLFVLHHLQIASSMWAAYLLSSILGCGIGLAHRRAYLDAALETFLLRKRLLARLHTDSLTNIYNREGWEVHAQRYLKRRLPDAGPFSVVYFDLDHFKRINDREGHAVGDKILRLATDIMRSRSRPGEVLARLGGEEFVALLPNADESAAWHYAERIRKAIAEYPGPVALTISAGVAQAEPGDHLEVLITRADNAMLEAKRQGRNRVLKSSTLAAGMARHPDPSSDAPTTLPRLSVVP